ncbi:MAG: contractile injection system tape measure protein [Saprospiraceae bacterium]
MNPNNKHNIKSLLFDIIFDDERRATELYDDIRRIHYQELEEAISRCLDQFVGVEEFASLDQIELDLGAIHYRNLNAQFGQKVYDSLTEKIKELLKGTTLKKGILISKSYNHIDLIRHYLVEGYLPWNTQENAGNLLVKCVKEYPLTLMELLKEIGKSEQVRKRIISRFDTSMIFEIIQVLSSTNSKFIQQFHRQVCRSIISHKALNIAESKLEKDLWLLILNYILINPLHGDQSTRLVKNVLIQFSQKFHFPFSNLIAILEDEIQDSNGEISVGVLNILSDISKGLNLNTREKINFKKEFSDLEFDKKNELLFQFLLEKNSTSNFESIRLNYLQQHLMQLLQTSESTLMEVLKDSKKTSILVKQMIKHFGLRPIYALIRRMEPGSFKTILDYHQSLVIIHRREPISAVSEKAFSYSLWEIILHILINKSGTYFNQISFLKNVISQLSNHYNIDFYELIEKLQQTALQIASKSSRVPVFIKLLSELKNENKSPQSKIDLTKQEISDISPVLKSKKKNKLLKEEKQEKSYYNQQQIEILIQDYFLKKNSSTSLSFIRRIIIESIKEEPQLIFQAIKKQSNYFSIIERLIYDFDEDLIQMMVKALEPKNYQSIIDYHQNTLILQKKQQIIRTSSIELSDALWNIILKILLSHSSSRFNKKYFLKTLLNQTAAHYNIQFHALINQLFNAINTTNFNGTEESNYRVFMQLIREIKLEEKAKKTKNLETKKAGSQKTKTDYGNQQKEISRINLSGSRISESLINLILKTPNQTQTVFTQRGFSNMEEAIQHLILFQKEALINALKKTSSTKLKEFAQRLPKEATEILIHNFQDHRALSIQDFLVRFNKRLYHFGIQQRENIMQKIKTHSLVFLLQNSFDFPQSFLNDLEIIIGQYKLPDSFFEEKESWKIPIRGSLDDNLVDLEKKLTKEIESQLLFKSKSALLLQDMLTSSRQKYSKIAYKKKKEVELGQEIFISNAGLVILNGYLHFFFDQCGYLDESGTIKPELAKRAAQLLQYVFNPTGEYLDEQLMLNKILCGLTANEILSTDFEANDLEKDITSKMLDAIISHWKMVSNSSQEGFRESWLHRKGKLTKKEKHWELNVETSSFDILLDYKPFTLSPVKFNWMKKGIKVNWR